ncbi:MAG: altronate dehydratase family protein [Bacteroidia bacterium]
MKNTVLKVHPDDNVIVALKDFSEGEHVDFGQKSYVLGEKIPTKHKFAAQDFEPGDTIVMYGITVGKATEAIAAGARISTDNVKHASGAFSVGESTISWEAPDISRFEGRSFMGFHRKDGRVGTRNYWLVVPLVFCENRNIKVMKDAMLEQLGYATEKSWSVDVGSLVEQYRRGANAEAILQQNIIKDSAAIERNRLFPHVDGIRFLTHEGGCGGIRQDAEALCRLLAGYITHPNVAGATVLSLGCQNAQQHILQAAIQEFDPNFDKPLFILEQQKSKSERDFIAEAVKKTFVGMMHANSYERKPAPLHHLSLGLECGGSDGFSGISANPALGYASDLLVALRGTAILSEFPELNGVEQEMINRCTVRENAEKFAHIMRTYALRAEESGSGFDMNPSPGNIKDGLITDAMKSAGAAKKGGTSPVTDVLDYTEQIKTPGLNLLCTPGNDVESTTALAGSGANMIVFTTGLGTPTGNPIAPVIKMASNSALASRMADIIDIDAGSIISGADTIQSKGEELLELIIKVASGEQLSKAEKLGQNDFIPWKRGVSL